MDRKLIDADALILKGCHVINEDGSRTIKSAVMEEDLENAPTVDAIPIDFIEKKIDSIRQYLREHDGEEFMGGLISKAIAYERLIEEWREENGQAD